MTLDIIASALPVNCWFNTAEFSSLTGIEYKSAKCRVGVMVKEKMLDKRKIGGRVSFIVSEDAKARMINQADYNRNHKGLSRVTKLMGRCKSEAILKQVGFI